ncbi:MAG: type IV pilus biogenesis/stability protein PilW [Casimicrobiaceae bacterium]|nr:type IV pilus biogenesis/stability protein PilW [Casimicrobiaceae bacterium]MCX8097884.1 type IV pilus biogenesis/stability protein PilW [Casimicrobiaceae bacterium]MDW8313228.1 type IV pilus biogenesis/stability protein PilW [Burkholderiales bacterium]
MSRRSSSLVVALVLASLLPACTQLDRFVADTPPTPQASTAATSEDPLRFRARVHAELGANYFQRGQLAVALEELNEAIRLDPRYGLAHSILGLVYAEMNDLPRAEAAFQRALSVAPNEGDVRNNYGAFLCRQNRTDEGLREFEAALALPLYPTPQLALENAGNCALSAGRLRVAEGYFTRLVQLQPFSSAGHQGLAAIAMKTSRWDEVRRHVERGLRAEPLTPELLYFGVCAERARGGREQEAEYLRQLRTRFPDSPLIEAINRGACS